jgi:integrase/recombinase XerD
MKLKPVVSVILDTRKANKEKLYPIKLRATFQVIEKGEKKWIQKYYSLGRTTSKAEFAIIKESPRTKKQKSIRAKMIEAENQANQILDDHSFVTVEMFSSLFAQGSLHTVGDVFNLIMREMVQAGRIGNYNLYKTTRNSIARFVNPELVKMKTRKKPDDIELNISFFEINKDWLKRYQTWLKDQGVRNTIYMRHLRAVYNKALDLMIIKPDLYPFGKTGFVIKKNQSRKIALTEEDKNRLLQVPGFAVDFWAFSFFNYGLNIADIASLKFKDVHDDVIHIHRQKTINTDASGKMLEIPLRPESKEIIARHGNKSLNPAEYVFPILSISLTPTQIKNRVNDFTGKLNTDLRKVGEKLELPFKLTTYTARHTFASIALEKGASLEFIQIALGHASMTTTVNYTSGLQIKTKRAIGARIYE